MKKLAAFLGICFLIVFWLSPLITPWRTFVMDLFFSIKKIDDGDKGLAHIVYIWGWIYVWAMPIAAALPTLFDATGDD